MCAFYCMLYSVVVNWRTVLLMMGETFSDRLSIDHETVSIVKIDIQPKAVHACLSE